MKQHTIDFAMRNRQESEIYWGERTPRWLRITMTMFCIVTIPLELAAELLIVFLGFVARTGSMFLWATNPIKEKQTESEEES